MICSLEHGIGIVFLILACHSGVNDNKNVVEYDAV